MMKRILLALLALAPTVATLDATARDFFEQMADHQESQSQKIIYEDRVLRKGSFQKEENRWHFKKELSDEERVLLARIGDRHAELDNQQTTLQRKYGAIGFGIGACVGALTRVIKSYGNGAGTTRKVAEAVRDGVFAGCIAAAAGYYAATDNKQLKSKKLHEFFNILYSHELFDPSNGRIDKTGALFDNVVADVVINDDHYYLRENPFWALNEGYECHNWEKPKSWGNLTREEQIAKYMDGRLYPKPGKLS